MTKVVQQPHQGTLLFPHEHLLIWEKQRPDEIYLKQMVNGKTRTFTFAQVADQTRRMANALLKLGLVPGDKVAIIAKNCAEWFIADLALMMAGMVSVPIFPTASRETIEYCLEHSECRMAFIGKLDNADACLEALSHLPEIITIGFPYAQTPECQLSYNDLLAEFAPLEQAVEQNDDSLMSIVYTSGTSGQPKGALLTFGAYCWTVNQITNLICVNKRDRLFSYLPLAHITERVYLFGSSISCGVSTAFPESLDTFIDNIKAQRPTLFLSVPRLWTLFQQRILEKLPQHKLTLLLRIPIIKHVVQHRIAKELGLDKARILGCGSASISPAVITWYQSIGLPISEAWGMTESFAFGALNYPYNPQKVGSIGKAAPGVQLKLNEQGELLMYSKGLFSGYYRNELATRKAFDREGWLRTGDIAAIDSDGFIQLQGRTNDNFKTAKGKFVSPIPIENMLTAQIRCEMLCLIGSGLSAPMLLILPPHFDPFDHKRYEASVYKAINAVNSQLQSHEQIKFVVISKQRWSVDNGILTPTLKIRRHVLEQKYHELGHNWPGNGLTYWQDG